MMPLLKILDTEVVSYSKDRLPKTIAARTRRIYDILSTVYPLSTYCFHSNAHKTAVDMSGIRDGMRVLEVATGSGEMFRRLVKANRQGETVGFDLSPRMAARTLRHVRQDFPTAKTHCGAVDARYLPFPDEAFDAVVCCYLFELLAKDDILQTLAEIHRALKPRGTFTLVCIGQDVSFFNNLYKVAGSLAPAFWGRQIEHRVSKMIRDSGFAIKSERHVKQAGYPSRVLAAAKR